MELPESINLEYMNVYAAPFGGPIAVTKNPKLLMKGALSSKPIIYIFTASGRLISTINVSTQDTKLTFVPTPKRFHYLAYE